MFNKVMFIVPRGRGRVYNQGKLSKGGGRKPSIKCNFHIMIHDNHDYNKNLQPYANRLRKEMTKAEACLWKYVLKGKQLRGYQFRRQRPILNYIVDFVCLELKLVVEVDGLSHHWEETMLKDHRKQTALEEAGFTVLRFRDEEVLNNINVVHEQLQNWIDDKVIGGSKSTPT